MELVTLDRYEMGGRLGTGADYEVRSAVDRETGGQVVIKRPVPQMIRLNQHVGAEARTERLLQAREKMGPTLSGVVQVLGYTEPTNHDKTFGESLGHEYRVTVEERAKGIPLLGDQMARITGVPIGVGQNLFALHPLAQPAGQPTFPIQRQLLEIEDVFLQAGYILLDLSPQNIFYQPGSAAIVVIDCGDLTPIDPAQEREPTHSRRPTASKDINNFCLEILKFYSTAQRPPQDAVGYRDPYGLRPIVRFEDELTDIESAFETADSSQTGTCRAVALDIIDKIRSRSYSAVADFRQDLDQYLDAVQQINNELPDDSQERAAWNEACGWLRADYWSKFLFEPDKELAIFQS